MLGVDEARRTPARVGRGARRACRRRASNEMCGSEQLGLDGHDEAQRVVLEQERARRSVTTATAASASVGGIGGGGDGRGAEAVGFTRDHRLQERLLAREVPVDGGPSAPGLPRDVVEGGLGDADPGDARAARRRALGPSASSIT